VVFICFYSNHSIHVITTLRLRRNVRVYLIGYILCIKDCDICRDIFGRIYIMSCRLPYVSGCVLSFKTLILYIYQPRVQCNTFHNYTQSILPTSRKGNILVLSCLSRYTYIWPLCLRVLWSITTNETQQNTVVSSLLDPLYKYSRYANYSELRHNSHLTWFKLRNSQLICSPLMRLPTKKITEEKITSLFEKGTTSWYINLHKWIEVKNNLNCLI
jgi:hypothetical protein